MNEKICNIIKGYNEFKHRKNKDIKEIEINCNSDCKDYLTCKNIDVFDKFFNSKEISNFEKMLLYYFLDIHIDLISSKINKPKGKYDIMTRYSLKNGKFGYYFHDKHDSVDLTLQIVLDKLNSYEKKNLKLTTENNKYKYYLDNNDLMKYII